jgi:hypothetical protein
MSDDFDEPTTDGPNGECPHGRIYFEYCEECDELLEDEL